MTAQVRFDKNGKRLPDTGHGCGCSLCELVGAPRYERRDDGSRSDAGQWSPLHRALVRLGRR